MKTKVVNEISAKEWEEVKSAYKYQFEIHSLLKNVLELLPEVERKTREALERVARNVS